MRDALEILLDTLQALKEEGLERVVADDASLARLHAAANALRSSGETAPVASKPARINTSSASGFSSSKPTVPDKAPPPVRSFPKPPTVHIPEAGTKAEKLAAVAVQMQADPVCNKHLHAGKNLVFGDGNPDSPVFFCGEAPGAEEETQGIPFVGPAGQLLDKIIAATGLSRRDVYIGNIMKWRPEMPTLVGNRPPTPEEMAYCLPYVVAQIEIIRPKVIVALGLTAVNGLLGNDADRKMGAIRGKQFDFHGVPVIPTYHPSYLLRNGTMKSKRMVWEDFLTLMQVLNMPISEKQYGYFLPKSA